MVKKLVHDQKIMKELASCPTKISFLLIWSNKSNILIVRCQNAENLINSVVILVEPSWKDQTRINSAQAVESDYRKSYNDFSRLIYH